MELEFYNYVKNRLLEFKLLQARWETWDHYMKNFTSINHIKGDYEYVIK